MVLVIPRYFFIFNILILFCCLVLKVDRRTSCTELHPSPF